MGSNDTRKIGKRSLQAQNWSLDINPHKSTKRAKAKERQAGKKIVREELKDENRKTRRRTLA